MSAEIEATSEGERGGVDARTRLLGLLALIALVHLPLLGFGLIYDDGWTLRSNGFLRPGHFDLGLLLSPEAAARHVPDAFRPTLVIFDALSYRLFGLAAWAHHGLSIALHVGVCALLARLLQRLGAPEMLVLGATACFGFLAIHAEAVAVVSFREDLLAALLGLAALLAGLRCLDASARPHRAAWGLAAIASMALACGAKLSAAPLPGLLLLLAWLRPFPGARLDLRERPGGVAAVLALLGIGVLLALAQTWLVHGGLSPYGAENPRVLATRVGRSPVLAASVQIHVAYLQQILAPLGLSPEYVDRGASWTDPATILAGLGLLAALALGIHGGVARRRPLLSFALLGWLLLCLPTSNLVGLPNMRADRFMYLPSLPLCVGLAALLLAAGRRLARTRLGAGLGAEIVWAPLLAFVLVQGSFGLAASRSYVSNATLWRTAIREAPDSARAHALLGLERLATAELLHERVPEEIAEVVERECELARRLDPRYELPEICLARLAAARKDWDLAYAHNQRALAVSPDRNDRIHAALAQLALDLSSEWLRAHPELGGDRRALARDQLERGLSAYPYSPELHAVAGRVHHRLGEADRALELYRRARSLRPDRWETVAWGVELALDLGDAPSAHHTWWAERELLERADPATRTRLTRRLAAARTNPDFSLLHSLLSPGVFPDAP